MIISERTRLDASRRLARYQTFTTTTNSTRRVNTLVCSFTCYICAYESLFRWGIEQFSNGITIISLYLNPLPNSTSPPIEHSIYQVMKEASLLYCLPDNPFFLPNAPESNAQAVQEAMYACKSLGLHKANS